MKSKIKDIFAERIDFWCPRSGSYFIYSTEIPVGEIIEVGARKYQQAKGLLQDQSPIQKVNEVATMLRNEILEAPSTYYSWPPTEEKLINNLSVLPEMFEAFLKSLISSKSKISDKKNRQILSIGQDIMFCIKTSLAVRQSKEQLLKRFVPSIIQPSLFVTFVWDNNDINPETLTGTSMHCTNGIMLQLTTEGRVASHTESLFQLEQEKPVKERLFKAIPNVLQSYISKEREQPPAIENVALNPSQKTADELSSREIDCWWCMLRLDLSRQNMEQTVPNWTGFNHLISTEHPSFHKHNLEAEEEDEEDDDEEDHESLGTDSEDEIASDVENE
eukprot:gene1798-2004_t